MDEFILIILVALIAAAPTTAAALGQLLRRRSINEIALENAQVAALINQTNMAASVSSNMMDAQADKVHEKEA